MAEKEAGGTLMRGPDGGLYYIPDDKLEAFRLPEDQIPETPDLMGKEGDLPNASALKGPAVQRAGLVASDTTTVSVVNIAAIRQPKR
jgi:hypothetical protein